MSVPRLLQAMRSLLVCLFTVTGCLLPFPAQAQDDWELRRDRDDIQVYTRPVPESRVDAIRAVAVIEDVRLTAVVALLDDVSTAEEWTVRCEESRVYRQVSATEAIIYMRTNLPLFYRDRWVLARSVWEQDPDTLEVTRTSEAIDMEIEGQRSGVRVTDSRLQWRLIPLDSGDVRIIYEGYADPGVALPGWIMNSLIVDAPFRSIRNFRDLVDEPTYRNADVDFITEP